METTTLRIRMETTSHRNFNRRSNRIRFRRLIVTVASFAILAASCSQVHADIPWPEVVQRLAYENEKLARRPQGHNGEYFVVCTLYYTPKESGFTLRAALMQHRSQNRDYMAERIHAIFFAR